MFLNTNDKIINLQNVSNINILKEKKRIIFNLNYSVQVPIDSGVKHISDYVYWDASSIQNFNDNIELLNQNFYFIKNFILKFNSGYININEISSIKFSDDKFRVIFNLSHPVTFKDNIKYRITSDFIYCNCYNQNGYEEYKQYIKDILKITE